MGLCRFLYDNRWKDGTLSSSTAHANFPDTNTRHRWATKVWRSTADTAQWLKVDRDMIVPPIQAVAIKGNNFSSAATVKFEWNSSDSWTTPAGSYTCDINNDTICGFLAGSRAYEWWRLYMDDGSNPNGYLEAGYVFIGPYLEPTRNFDYREGEKPHDPSVLTRSEGGQLSAVVREHFLQKSYTFQHLPASDKTLFDYMFDTIGTRGSLFFVADSDYPMTTSYYVRLLDMGWTYETSNLWTLSLSMEELL